MPHRDTRYLYRFASACPAADRLAISITTPVMLGRFGPAAHFHMSLVWATLMGFAVVDAIWLVFSRLSFAESNWNLIGQLMLLTSLTFAVCGLILHRLRHDASRLGVLLGGFSRRIELFGNALLTVSLLGIVVITYSCLGTGAAFPLRDPLLAQIDQSLGFLWGAFVEVLNSQPWTSWALVKAYQSTGVVLVGTIVLLSVCAKGERLAEFLALLCLTSIGIAIGLLILPAAGAYAHHRPASDTFSNFSSNAGLWHRDLLMALRTGAAPVIDFTIPNSNCLVTFPSGHTILAIVMTYALRLSRWTFVPALVLNSLMLVSTIPEGGHYLFDLVAGIAIAVTAIAIVRLPLRSSRSQSASQPALGLVSG